MKEKIRYITQTVTRTTGVSLRDLRGLSRLRKVVDARRIAINLILENNVLTKKEVTVFFNRHRATINHTIDTHQDLLKNDIEYKQLTTKITEKLLQL